MFKQSVDRYKNYINNFTPIRNVISNLKHQKIVKIFYKKIVINSMYLKRQNVNLYKPLKKFKYTNMFLHNIPLQKKKFGKDDKRIFFSWTMTNSVYNSKITKNAYYDFFDLFFRVFPKTPLTNYKYYWMTAFMLPTIKTRFYYFTNRIKFFVNQRLVRQHILIMYNTTNKNNTYSNNSKFFKGLILKKKLNTVFLFKSVIFHLYPKFGKKSYFFRHHNYLKKYIAETYLKINAYIAQW